MAFAPIRLAVVLANPKSNIDPFQTLTCSNRTLKIIWPGKIWCWCLIRLITFSYSILRRVFSDLAHTFHNLYLWKSGITIPMNFSSSRIYSTGRTPLVVPIENLHMGIFQYADESKFAIRYALWQLQAYTLEIWNKKFCLYLCWNTLSLEYMIVGHDYSDFRHRYRYFNFRTVSNCLTSICSAMRWKCLVPHGSYPKIIFISHPHLF